MDRTIELLSHAHIFVCKKIGTIFYANICWTGQSWTEINDGRTWMSWFCSQHTNCSIKHLTNTMKNKTYCVNNINAKITHVYLSV